MNNSSQNTPGLAIGIIIIILLVAGGIYFFAIPRATAPALTATSTSQATSATVNSVSYICDTGSIQAIYSTPSGSSALGSVALTLSDGRTLNLPQVMSGSGIRYEQGAGTANDVQFSSEGNNAFLMENGKITYNNCVAGTTGPAAGGAQTFTDQGKTFSFSYQSPVTVSGGGVGYSTDWMLDATTSGLLLAKATLPGSFEPKTNFADATLTVGTSPDPTAVAECLTYVDGGNGVQKSTVTINGVQYEKFVTNDAGAGNLYMTTSYRTVRNSQCYAIEYTIHSSELGNYPPSAGISAFDESKVQGVMDAMVQSFKFL